MLLSRDIYGVLGIFVFGSLVTQLLTDTSKYTIGEFEEATKFKSNQFMCFKTTEWTKHQKFFSPRSAQAALPHCLSAKHNFDQHWGSIFSFVLVGNLWCLRCVACRAILCMSPTIIAWGRSGSRRRRERLVGIDGAGKRPPPLVTWWHRPQCQCIW